jgi:hypothetical protein
MQILTQTLDDLRIGPAKTFAGLTVFPLIGADHEGSAYTLLDVALDEGSARVTEVSASGAVPELRFENTGKRPVLILDGEELVGAKQNRVLNLTILAPAKEVIIIPVSCVEAGRWAEMSKSFSLSKQVMYSRGRARKAAQVSGNLARKMRARSDQAAIWGDIDQLAERYSVASETSRMSDVFDSKRADIDGYVKAFAAVDEQVGAVFALGGRVRGVELLSGHDALRGLFSKLVRSWALDAIAAAEEATEVPPAEAVREFLKDVGSAKTTTHDAVGLGTDVRLSSDRLAGGALVHEDCVVHLCAFRLDGDDGARDSRVSLRRFIRASDRARRRS